MADSIYEERYCAFIDILGFSELISESNADPAGCSKIRTLLETIYEPINVHIYRFMDADFRAQSISDAIALSAKANDTGLFNILLVLEDLARTLLMAGYFTRGGLTRGPLYHDDKMIFGKALLDAYYLESRIARYPRIMIARAVVADGLAGRSPNVYGEYFRQANDDVYYLHVLRRLPLDDVEDHGDWMTLGTQIEPYRRMRAAIERRFSEAADNPNHFEKVKWFAEYWNDVVAFHKLQNIETVKAPTLDRSRRSWSA